MDFKNDFDSIVQKVEQGFRGKEGTVQTRY